MAVITIPFDYTEYTHPHIVPICIAETDLRGAGTGVVGFFYGDGGPAISASLYQPQGVAVDGAGNLYIADSYDNRIRKVTTDGVTRPCL
jgi:hypothetical protein